MKKLAIAFLIMTLTATTIIAKEGEMGYFGGVSSGVKLPTIVERSQSKKTSSSKYSLPYTEYIYLTGIPEKVTGTIEIKPGTVDKADGAGKYTETYLVKASNEDDTVKVTRNISITTEYVYNPELRQTTKTSKLSKWTETVVANGNTYSLDKSKSYFSKSILEDYTPGVTYYRGDVQYEAVYRNVTSGDGYVTVSVSSPIYGYEQAYAKSETQKRSVTIDTGTEQFYIEEMPSVTVHKDIQYDKNELDAISMHGNYKEFIRSHGYINYNILQGSDNLAYSDKVGSTSVETPPIIEQLVIPKIANIQGHPAESDIKRMYSIGVIDATPQAYAPNKQVTKKEYIKMMVNALQIPVENEKALKKKENPFKDVSKEDAAYAQLIAAYEAGLISGGYFNGNAPVTMEQAIVFNVRALGLERLGLVSMGIETPFIDNAQISDWARASVYAAHKLGIVNISNGTVSPQKKITNADAATLMNSLINYMRYDLQKDYNEKMVL